MLAAPLRMVKSTSRAKSDHTSCPAVSGLIHCAPCQLAAVSRPVSHHADRAHADGLPWASQAWTVQ